MQWNAMHTANLKHGYETDAKKQHGNEENIK